MTQEIRKILKEARTIIRCHARGLTKDWDERATKALATPSTPRRTWVGLEGEEIRNLWEEAVKPNRSTMTMVTSFARAIEAKLKGKNT